MGIDDKTIELLETLSPFSCVFLALHLHAVTNRNMEMASDEETSFQHFPSRFFFFFLLFLCIGLFPVEKRKRKTQKRREMRRGEKKKGSHRGLTL
jgi:hypothetical protein